MLPPGFGMYMAEARGETGSNPTDFAGTAEAELWATPDASATTGSWFVVSRGPQHATGRNSYRMIVDGIEVVFEHDPASGQTRLSFTKDGNDMAITAFGWIDRQLVRLVRSVNIDDSVIRFSDGFFTSDHQRILQADPADGDVRSSCDQGRATRQVFRPTWPRTSPSRSPERIVEDEAKSRHSR